MKVTKDGFKDRQLHIEDYLQMISAEQKEYAEVSAHQRIAENNDIITDFQTDNLMEQILHKDNLNKAYKKVKSNKGAGGVDGMSVDEFLGFLKDNQEQLIQQIKDAEEFYGFYLVPAVKGKWKIKVRMMCSEYLEPEEYEIDIEVV